jgi:hypothetical protein
LEGGVRLRTSSSKRWFVEPPTGPSIVGRPAKHRVYKTSTSTRVVGISGGTSSPTASLMGVMPFGGLDLRSRGGVLIVNWRLMVPPWFVAFAYSWSVRRRRRSVASWWVSLARFAGLGLGCEGEVTLRFSSGGGGGLSRGASGRCGGAGARGGARACGVRVKNEVIVGWPVGAFVLGSFLLIVGGLVGGIGGAVVAGVGGFGVVAEC